MTLNTDQTSKTSVSFREWIWYVLSLLIFFPLYLRLIYKDSVLSKTVKWLMAILVVFSPSFWIVVLLIAGIADKQARKARYAEVEKQCLSTEVVYGYGYNFDDFKCEPYADVTINSDKIGKADVEFLNRTFRSVEKDDTATRTESRIILEQILYKHATYLSDTTFKGMYTYILKQGDVAIEPNIWQDKQGIHEDTDWDAPSANIALPLSSEQWDQILHLFEHTFESGGMKNFELGFQVHEDHLEIISHPSAVFDKTKHYIPSDPYGNPPGLQSPTHWSTGSIPKVNITTGHLWMECESGRIVLYDATHKLWFVRSVDSLLFVEH